MLTWCFLPHPRPHTTLGSLGIVAHNSKLKFKRTENPKETWFDQTKTPHSFTGCFRWMASHRSSACSRKRMAGQIGIDVYLVSIDWLFQSANSIQTLTSRNIESVRWQFQKVWYRIISCKLWGSNEINDQLFWHRKILISDNWFNKFTMTKKDISELWIQVYGKIISSRNANNNVK